MSGMVEKTKVINLLLDLRNAVQNEAGYDALVLEDKVIRGIDEL